MKGRLDRAVRKFFELQGIRAFAELTDSVSAKETRILVPELTQTFFLESTGSF